VKRFTLVSTVFNESLRLTHTIEDIENQSIKPDEIIITDAGSTDGTYEKLIEWSKQSALNIKILQKAKCNVAQGRNLAITNAAFDLIVSTDFGCRFHPHWLKTLVEPFNDPNVRVVGGAYGVEENNIETLPARANFILTNGYHTVLNESFIPSSRSIAYYKSVWEDVGGYCEWLTLAADDLVFGKAIRAKGYHIHLVHNAFVYWGRHERLKGYAKESFRYGLGDGEARVNVRNTISNTAELTLRYLLFASILLIIVNIVTRWFNPFFALIALLFLPGLRAYIFAIRNWLKFRSPKYSLGVLLYSFYLIEVTRLNYIEGFIKGYFFSSKHVKLQAASLSKIQR
jgi:glycosyltransferase involved in cell wall biosynthesis